MWEFFVLVEGFLVFVLVGVIGFISLAHDYFYVSPERILVKMRLIPSYHTITTSWWVFGVFTQIGDLFDPVFQWHSK